MAIELPYLPMVKNVPVLFDKIAKGRLKNKNSQLIVSLS